MEPQALSVVVSFKQLISAPSCSTGLHQLRSLLLVKLLEKVQEHRRHHRGFLKKKPSKYAANTNKIHF